MSFQELYFVYSGDNRNTVSAKVLNKINAFIFIADFRNLKLLWTNRYCSNKLGFSSAELLNMTSDEILWLVHPECREILINSIKNILNSRDESNPGFLKIRTKGNRWIWIMLTFRIFEKSRDGKINKVLSYAIEVDIHQLHNQLIILTHKDKAVAASCYKTVSAREKK
jgi:PAS domain-containing protein